MDFEYDLGKSTINRSKHGIDFDDAQSLWEDARRVEIPARDMDEPRWLVIGKIGSCHWSAAITRRGDNIRLISVRRAREDEVEFYESDEV